MEKPKIVQFYTTTFEDHTKVLKSLMWQYKFLAFFTKNLCYPYTDHEKCYCIYAERSPWQISCQKKIPMAGQKVKTNIFSPSL
jgi:hypothetical protein